MNRLRRMKRQLRYEVLTIFVSIVTVQFGLISQTLSGCNPMVDILFVLDGSSYINETELLLQKSFIGDLLGKHQAPKGAVRVAASVCSETNVSSVPFTDSAAKLFDTLNKVSDERTQHCLESVNFKFKAESRDGISRIAVVIRAGGKWSDIYTRSQGEAAKQEKIVVVVVAVGIKDFETLSSLQSLASEDGTFFVLSKYSDLRMLASSLSKGSCKPISLAVSPENSVKTETTPAPSNDHESCIQLSSSSFKRYIPGFGYTRKDCTDGQTLQLQTCSCQ